MKTVLENYLWENANKNGQCEPPAYDVIEDMIKKGMINSHKQAYDTLEKWVRNNKWNYGSNIAYGWQEINENKSS